MTTVVLAPLTRQLASTIRIARAPHRRSAMAETILAAAASSWAVLMGIAPVLQIRRMVRERSSRQVSVGYFTILLIGFALWIAYGAAAGLLALVIPNTVALLIGVTVIVVALRLRGRPPHPEGSLSGRPTGGLSAQRVNVVAMAEFIHADLRGSRFERVDLADAQFRAVDLSGARFRGVALNGAVMRGVELVDADIHGEIVDVKINGVDI